MSIQQLDGPAATVARAPAGGRYLFGPVVDFLCLGGGTFLVLPVLLLLPVDVYRPSVAAVMMFAAHFINHPHFAHSYQIFYRNFAAKVRGHGYSRGMRIRYIVAGIVVPIGLTAFFAASVLAGDARVLGYGANIMGFFVGWHYVKQGYGMLMVDAVLKKRFFQNTEKKVFLLNSYAVWVLAWLKFNVVAAENAMWGLKYYTFPIPDMAVTIATVAAVATSLMAVWTLAQAWRKNGGSLPYNGVMAYGLSLYLWLLFARVHPLFLLVIPALHSLQYLVVVWRYESNYEKAKPNAQKIPDVKLIGRWIGRQYRLSFGAFVFLGGLLGFLGFWFAPMFLQVVVPYDKGVFGASLFLFIFWIFINVHHYFLDNVMWRKGNPDVQRFLFS